MSFPDSDHNWTDVVDFLEQHSWHELTTISPVEFCNKITDCFPYEWSYWKELSAFDCLILHKGMTDRLKTDFLEPLKEGFDYVYGNPVFNVYVSKHLNHGSVKGNEVHFSVNAIFQAIKTLLKKGKQFKAKSGKKNILLVTANHCGNIGDDAITLASEDILKAVYPEANIVIDKGPASKELIAKVDLVVIGGGGVFYDNCFYNAQNYCQYLLYAHELGIKSCAIGIGAQGIKTELGIELFRRAIDFSEFIVVRDINSRSSLTEVVQVKTPVYVKQDVVYTLKSEGNKVLSRKTDKPLLLFSLLDASRMPTAKNTLTYQRSQDECMAFLVQHFEVKLLVQSRDDLALFNQLKSKYDLDIVHVNYNEVRAIINIYKQSDLVITSRLHGFIFAANAQVPIITVASKNPGSKLGSMVFDSVPSAARGYIILREYDLEKLQEKINIYQEDRTQLIPDFDEVSACQQLAAETADMFKQHIPELTS